MEDSAAYSPYQSREAGGDAASRVEFQSQTKAKHGPQNKIFPAKKKGSTEHKYSVNKVMTINNIQSQPM